MDPLDLILLEAWNRISKKVREDRVLALKRSRRRFTGILTRPMREWCLVIRASDTRIDEFHAVIDRPAAVEAHEPHSVTLNGSLIRKMTKPVSIDWPGVTYEEAARICGRTHRTMKPWARLGMFKIDRYPEFGFPRNESGKGRAGGNGRPYVWTPSPIDPNNSTGRTPHPVWGTLWQTLWEQFPEEYEMEVKRVPVWKRWKSDLKFRGWNFVCPGRIGIDGERTSCGQRSNYLYAPQTVWTLAQAIEGDSAAGFDMPPPQESGLAGQWFPGLGDPVKDAAGGLRSLACKKCWHVRSACFANNSGWGEFISTISGGLLYGHEVPRPLDVCPKVRKIAEYVRPKRGPRVKTICGDDNAMQRGTIANAAHG